MNFGSAVMHAWTFGKCGVDGTRWAEGLQALIKFFKVGPLRTGPGVCEEIIEFWRDFWLSSDGLGPTFWDDRHRRLGLYWAEWVYSTAEPLGPRLQDSAETPGLCHTPLVSRYMWPNSVMMTILSTCVTSKIHGWKWGRMNSTLLPKDLSSTTWCARWRNKKSRLASLRHTKEGRVTLQVQSCPSRQNMEHLRSITWQRINPFPIDFGITVFGDFVAETSRVACLEPCLSLKGWSLWLQLVHGALSVVNQLNN